MKMQHIPSFQITKGITGLPKFDVPKRPEPVYVDYLGKHWQFVAQFNAETNGTDDNEGKEMETKLRHFFYRNFLCKDGKSDNYINLRCKNARSGKKPRCTFRGIFVKATTALYTHGTHNHPLVLKGDNMV